MDGRKTKKTAGRSGTRRRHVLVVENDIEKRTFNLQGTPTDVVDETQLPEPVHETTDPRPRCAYHFCEDLLADVWDYSILLTILPETGEQQQYPGQSFFTGFALGDLVRCSDLRPPQLLRCDNSPPASGRHRSLLGYARNILRLPTTPLQF